MKFDIINFEESSTSMIDSVVDLYCSIFVGQHYSEAERLQSKNNIKKHSGYGGFKGLIALMENRVIGFTYGYTSTKGQFYRSKLEAVLDENQRDYWLHDCFEYVELAVNRDWRGKGVAGLLHDQLLDGLTHLTAILTTTMHNRSAQNLYIGKGWQLIKENIVIVDGTEPQLIMGKVLYEGEVYG